MSAADRTPVLVAVGEALDRPESLKDAREPVVLMAEALRRADADGGGAWLNRIESLDLVGLVTWRYQDPVSLLCRQLGIQPARKVNASMGGETPIRLIHEAAVRIAQGEVQVAAVVGGESMSSMNRARKEGTTLDWTPLADKQDAVRFANDRIEVRELSRSLGITTPAQMYPLYEVAAQSAWKQSPAEGNAESAELWSRFAAIAASNPYAWIRSAPAANKIATPGRDNRPISWPYTKWMMANPAVNQAAAIIVTSLAVAGSAGVPADKIIYLWGGAAAAEPDDYLVRDRYDHSTAQAAVLSRAVEIAGGDVRRFDLLELYSCFPVVPKMALRQLRLTDAGLAPTVAGGLTFFGGPLNNYMSHAVAAMVRALRRLALRGPTARQPPGSLGLLYGQGGFVTKHHALVVGTMPPPACMDTRQSVQAAAEAARGPVPPVLENFSGEAGIETYTVLYDRDSEPTHGVVVLRTANGARTMARVTRDDSESLALLTSTGRSAVGVAGRVHTDLSGVPVWQAGARRAAMAGK